MNTTICRACLNVLSGNEISYSIFNYDEKDEKQKKIYIKIMELTGILIVEENKDNLPKEICKKCYENLNNSYNFRNLCKISDEVLKKQYDVIKKESNDFSDIEMSEKFDLNNSDIKKERLGSEDIKNITTQPSNKLQKLHIDPLTQNDFKSIKKYTFTTKLQNEFVEDFEHDSDSEFVAKCKYCKVKISVKYKGRLSLVKHLKSQKHNYLKYICGNDKNHYSKENSSSNEFEYTEKKRKLSIKSNLSSDILTDISDYEPTNDFSSEKDDSDDNSLNEHRSVSERRISKFNQSLQEEFKEYFISTESPSNAFCIFCKRTVSVKNKGRSSLSAHISSKKHQKNQSDISQLEIELSVSPKKEDIEIDDQWLDISKINDDFENLSTSKMTSSEKSKLKKSKGRYCKFNRELQEKMKNDFEPVQGSDYEAFCKTCKTKISMKKGSLCLLRHLQTRKHLNIYDFEPKGKNPGQIIKKTFICEHCGNIYDNRRRYRDHVELHSDIKRFKCEICEKEFRTSPQLKAHMRTHTGEKPFQCSFCGLRFSDLSTRTKHERIHTDERPYGCDTCGKSFRTSNTRREHVRIHTGEKPYNCNVCDLQFSRRYHLTQHCNSKIHQSKARAIKNE